LELPGPLHGLLHIRASADLASLVSKRVFEKEGLRARTQAAFKEFRELFAGRLMADLWGQHGTWFKSNFPSFTQAACRDFQPSAHWVFFFEEKPIEVYLWFDRDGREKEDWA
jgi:hypothetical protein